MSDSRIPPARSEGASREKRSFETRAIHAGKEHNPTAALTPPIFQSSTFKLESAAQGAELAQSIAPAEFYTRWGNPTTKHLEAILADLEGSEAALAFASGMGAISAVLFSTLSPGDHLLVGRSIYSGVNELANGFLPRFGVECSFVDASQVEKVESAVRKNTRVILVESPTNPTLEICDLAAIAAIGKAHGVLTALDNTFATPVNQNPLAYGFDVSIHAATKFIGGHSDATAGVICAGKEFIQRAWYHLKLHGACLSPFESWLLIRGVKTLYVRVREQNRSALEIARFLQECPQVERVHYPGLESHPDYAIARQQMKGYGGVVSFDIDGDLERTRAFIHALKIPYLAPSLGGVEALVSHPATVSYSDLSWEARQEIGITDQLIRYAVGVEDFEDLIADIEAALDSI